MVTQIQYLFLDESSRILSSILAALLEYLRGCRPEIGIWAQKVSDELAEVDAVFAPVERAPPSCPPLNGGTVHEEVLPVAVVRHHRSQGPHIDRSGV